VGRNAKENDLLTRTAHSEDLWFHAQGVPGSHVILKVEGKNPPLEDLLFAARLAAYHSKARGERQVPVDYTRKKHVWRPRKAPPGQVLYTQAKTLFVEGALPEGLEAG
jgi:predicted ribosome quality control (RQC) complex YloA/Tae2 family protein